VANLAASSPTAHHLFFSQTNQLPASAAPFAAEPVHKVEAYRQTLTHARPAVLVMIGSDRFHQLCPYNMRSSSSARRRLPHPDIST
jgi:protocatechuate 4,5-dioxygenase beta chain